MRKIIVPAGLVADLCLSQQGSGQTYQLFLPEAQIVSPFTNFMLQSFWQTINKCLEACSLYRRPQFLISVKVKWIQVKS